MSAVPEHLNTHDPSIRRMLIQKYDTYGEKYVYEEFGVTGGAVRKWKRLLAQTGSLSPRFANSGMKSTLTPKDIRTLERELIKDPYATNAKLAAKIKNKISPQAVGKIISKSPYQFKWKYEGVDVEESFSPDVARQGHAYFAKARRIPEDDRIYVDETWISPGIKRRRGRFPKGARPWSPRNRKYKRVVVIAAITKKGWLHPGKIYDKPSITNDDFDRYVIKTLCPRIGPGKTVIWDRYGRSGRAKNPTARHYSPKAREAIESTGASLLMLPPSGKYGNPIEPVLGDTKKIYEKKIAKKMESRMPSKIPFSELSRAWHDAEKEMNPNSFIRAFKERANGQEFNRICKERGLPEKQ